VGATAGQIARLRRMVDEADETTYTDETLAEYIEERPSMDERGELPFEWDTSTEPPTQDENESWIETYDLAAAAADVWAEKAAVLAQDYDTNADGASLSRSQAYEQAMKQSRYWSSRRKPSTIALYPSPRPVPSEDLTN
jgi:hypothetical protein